MSAPDSVTAPARSANFDKAVLAIIDGDIELLKALLAAEPALVRARSTSAHRSTLLHYVAANGVEDHLQRTPPNAADIARVLLRAGAEPDATADVYDGHWTTLALLVSSVHPARAGVQSDLVETLVRGGAQPTAQALRTAVTFGYTGAARKLRELGAPIEEPIVAAAVGTITELDALLATATTPHALEHALAWAAHHGREEVVEHLLAKGATGATGAIGPKGAICPDLSIKEPVYGGTALGMALYPHPTEGRPRGNPQIAARLRAHSRFAPATVNVESRADGTLVLSSPRPLERYPDALGAHLVRWAAEAPTRSFLLERREGQWSGVTYAEALAAVRSIGQWLLDNGLSATRPVLLLSDNSVAHALVQLAAMHVGVPAAPVSPAYSLMSKDHAKLRAVVEQLGPGAVFFDDDPRFEPALAAIGHLPRLAFSEAARTTATAAVDDAFAKVGPDSIAKILFTSGSTGSPKGVVNTQRMLCSNQQALAQSWLLLDQRPPVVVDWLPWSHTFGGNHNFNMLLRAGGTLYVDSGKPAPGLFDHTVAALREISPTMYFNVPRGFELLAGALEKDRALAEKFFAELELIFYAAAALPQATWSRLTKVADDVGAKNVSFVAAWGSTETSPLATQVHFPIERAGVIGLPIPGTDLKLAPSGTKLEMRLRGPNITPGYWSRGEILPAPRDEEGYLPTGDAGRLEDPARPERGVVFDGRLAENFKLTSGTWVAVGELRLMLLDACAPLVSDAVIAGENRPELGALLFLSAAGAALAPDELKSKLEAALATHNEARSSNSTFIARALVLREPPSIDAGEITDKGYINQRAVLERRPSQANALFEDLPEPSEVISLTRRASR